MFLIWYVVVAEVRKWKHYTKNWWKKIYKNPSKRGKDKVSRTILWNDGLCAVIKTFNPSFSNDR